MTASARSPWASPRSLGAVRTAFKVTIRSGPEIQRREADTLGGALDLVEQAGRALSAGPRRDPVDLRYREFSPSEQVAHRIELRGPGVRAGVDVRGDNSAQAFVGRLRRRLVEPRKGESPYDALRRTLSSVSVEP